MEANLNELALFAGAGGGILGGKLLGWRTVCAVEWDAYARDVLVARQNDGCLEAFPIWDDVQTFDGRPWRGRIDVVSGGFPCQDISAAGKGAGIEGERSGMWKEMARIIGEVLPRFVLVENSPMLVGRGLAVVLADLAEMGYDAEWGIVGAHHVSAPHKRDRIWIVANAHSPSGKDQRMLNGSVGEGIPSINEPERSGVLSCFRNGGEDVANTASQGTRGLRNQSGEEGSCCSNELSGVSGGLLRKDKTQAISNTWSERGQLSTERELTAIEQPWSDSEERSLAGIAREWWATEPDVGGKADGMATKLDGGKAHD